MNNDDAANIQGDINRIFEKEMSKHRGVSIHYNAMVKRKNLLETKLFKQRYLQMVQHLNGMPNAEKAANPFLKSPWSIFNESLADPKMEIPNNREIFQSVIRELVDQGL